ncbi:MAG: YHS domain-containing (seleno)protein [Burkholderiaceae bacterium]
MAGPATHVHRALVARRSSAVRRALLTLMAVLAGCGHPMAVMTGAGGDPVMLLGHDPVAYFTEGRSRRGDPAIMARYDEVVYYFASDEHRRMFVAAPDRYVPQYGGFCSSGAAYGLKLGSDPTEFAIRDGRLFIFGDVLGRTAWELDPAWNIERADQVWPEAAPHGWRWQSLKRYAFKVDWYRDGRAIRAEFERRHPGQPLPAYDPGGMITNLFLREPGWRAREGFGQPAVGLVGVDACPPACPGQVSEPFGQ